MVAEHAAHAVPRSLAPECHDDLLALRLQAVDMRHDRLENVDTAVAALRREAPAGARTGIEYACALGHCKRRDPRELTFGQTLLPFVFGQIQPAGRQRLVDRAAARVLHRLAPCVVIIRDLLEALARGILTLRLDHNRCVAEIVKQRVHLLLEQGQPMFHAGMPSPLRHRLVKLVVGRRRTELGHIAHAEAADGLGDELELRDRDQVERAHVEQRALRLGIERADRFQGIAEEIETNRLVEPGREKVEDAAADRIFAGLAHGRGTRITIVLQPGDDGIHRDHLAGRHRQGLGCNRIARRDTLDHGIDRRQHDQRLLAAGQPRQTRQCGQPLRKNAAMGRDTVIGLTVPRRELQQRQIRRKELQCTRQLLHPRTIAADDRETDRWLLRSRGDGARQIGNHEPFGTLGDIGKGERAAGREQRCGRFGCRFHAP